MTKKIFLCLFLLAFVSSAFCAKLDRSEYYNKVLGCWNGKCIGGGLGMPREGAWWSNQLNDYPEIDGYVGYIGNLVRGWTGFLDHQTVPTDGEWHKIVFSVTVPEFDTNAFFAAPIIGVSYENYSKKTCIFVKDIKITSHDINFDKNMKRDFSTTGNCWYNNDGWFTIDFPENAERGWVKTENFRKFGTDIIKPGDTFTVEMNAKWFAGDNRFGFAFDYMDKDARGFGPDDDTSYQVIGLLALEKYGPNLTAEQIGKSWVEYINYNIPDFLAEGIALERLRKGVMPPESGNHAVGNAIGGQMKGEIWGLICPGRPDLAAEYARRDGIVAHKDDGVYGEMFVAAMQAAAFYESDVEKIIETGLSVIPADCKYAKTVKDVISQYKSGKRWVQIIRDVKKEYPTMCDPVYPECAIITLALLEGKGDFEYTIKTAFYCGSDTDCDTATVGALIGTIIGYKAIPKKWVDPIGNKFRCGVKGYTDWNITDLCRKICNQGDKVLAYHGKGNKFN